MRPLFLFSLPRSGSTLLQRILACHPEIKTTAEPWLLLPWLAPITALPGSAAYNYHHAREAIDDFTQHLSEGRSSYLSAVRKAANRLYADVAEEHAYFLDKTPRYHLIIDEIAEAFPEARLIILWRNPLAAAASMMDTWSSGRWNLHRFEIDLREGVINLLRAQEQHQERLLEIRFEQLLAEPEAQFSRLLKYLELEADPRILSDFHQVDVSGRMGDPTGVKKYRQLNTENASRWVTAFSNPLRHRWAKSYIDWLGNERLQRMGYDRHELLDTLNHSPTTARHLASDAARQLYLPFYRAIRAVCLKIDTR